ncbi:MAG: hypothetical protein GY716_04325 [bacterium]|nr:hypothetical protein [bacterium]
MGSRLIAALRRAGRGRPGSMVEIGLLCALLAACGVDRPLVERYEQGEWVSVPFDIVSMGGQRAAAEVVFVLRLEGTEGRRLVVEGTVEINPQAKLVGGNWVEERGETTRSGSLSSAVVDFFGGQGDRPSLGGQFTLSADEVAVYRLNLPATLLTTAR